MLPLAKGIEFSDFSFCYAIAHFVAAALGIFMFGGAVNTVVWDWGLIAQVSYCPPFYIYPTERRYRKFLAEVHILSS